MINLRILQGLNKYDLKDIEPGDYIGIRCSYPDKLNGETKVFRLGIVIQVGNEIFSAESLNEDMIPSKLGVYSKLGGEELLPDDDFISERAYPLGTSLVFIEQKMKEAEEKRWHKSIDDKMGRIHKVLLLARSKKPNRELLVYLDAVCKEIKEKISS